MFTATPYEQIATTMSATPTALLVPSPSDGSATSTTPRSPMPSPVITPRAGSLRAMSDATTAVASGTPPLSMPVTADDTRCSA